jgi:uncharacterized protein YfaS (alpha-2-macroglobulin family)
MKNPCNILGKRFSITIVILFLGLVIIFLGCSGGEFSGYNFTISGAVSGAVKAGVTIALIDESEQQGGIAVTDSNGNYTFNNLSNGPYVVKPSLSGFTFIPTSQVVTISSATVTNIDFTSVENTQGE